MCSISWASGHASCASSRTGAAVSAVIHNDAMAITMDNYGLTWTDADGKTHAAVCHYDKNSAEDRQTELEAAGCTAVEVVSVKVGQVLQPKS